MRANFTHNGCAVEYGPDGKLWVSMGDAGDLSLPQRLGRLNGKILRMNTDGSVPADNPFSGSRVYSRGHRNPQGIAFRPRTGRAYAVEHGPDVHDEINRLRAGGNYGWPCWTGTNTPGPGGSDNCRSASSYDTPAWSSGSSTIATSGAAFVRGPNWEAYRGDLFVATLKESDARRFEIRQRGRVAVPQSTLFNGRFGRLRAMVRGPGRNHSLYTTTSNGNGDDKVVRLTTR